MNREILFRGKRFGDGEWVDGYFAKYRDFQNKVYTSILQFDKDDFGDAYCCGKVPVIPETVGQYTGLTDKNGVKIFEGDIVCIRYSNGKICCIGDVQFSYGVYGAEWIGHKKDKGMVGSWGQLHNLRRFDDDIINDIEVIGNIYDNPELLEDEE